MSALRMFFLALLVVVAMPALAGGSPEERDEIFQRFEHKLHQRPLERAGLPCEACHQVGATLGPTASARQLSSTFLTPPEGACHECHAPTEGGFGAGDGMPQAPHRCSTCHEHVTKPDSHAIGWIDLHGGVAQEGTVACMNCHNRVFCTDCHDRRQTAGQRVHDRSWLTVHGIAVRADPAACDTCHVQSECTSCHASGSGWGRNP